MLLDEIGPAHKKKFFVSLKLGLGNDNEETFTANSTSIKKAQHAAAELALKQTKYKKPIRRVTNSSDKDKNPSALIDINDPTKLRTHNKEYYARKRGSASLAPTVLLNSLAMKLGLVANYTHTMTSSANSIDLSLNTLCSSQSKDQDKEQPIKNNTSFTSDLSQSFESQSNNYTNFTNTEYEPFKYAQDQLATKDQSDSKINESNPSQIKVLLKLKKRIKKKNDNLKQQFFVKLKFADVEFSGKGITLQLAKHDAASKALNYFSNAENFLNAKHFSANSAQNKNAKANMQPQFYKQTEGTSWSFFLV